jgi:hypothetical protein
VEVQEHGEVADFSLDEGMSELERNRGSTRIGRLCVGVGVGGALVEGTRCDGGDLRHRRDIPQRPNSSVANTSEVTTSQFSIQAYFRHNLSFADFFHTQKLFEISVPLPLVLLQKCLLPPCLST